MADQERAAALADEIEAHTAAFGDFEALGVKVHENRNEVITALRRLAEQSAPAPADALKAVARALAEIERIDRAALAAKEP